MLRFDPGQFARRAWLTAAFLILVGSCERPAVAVPPMLSATPFSTLDVRPGTPASDLKSRRPGVLFRPLVGYQEMLDDTEIIYSFAPHSVGEREKPGDRNPVDAVFALRSSSSTAATDSMWMAAVRGVAAVAGAPVSCQRFGGEFAGYQTSWIADSLELTISSFGVNETEERMIPDRVAYALTRPGALPPRPGGTAISCPSAR